MDLKRHGHRMASRKHLQCPPLKMTRRNKGLLAVIVCPELAFHEVACINPAAEQQEQK